MDDLLDYSRRYTILKNNYNLGSLDEESYGLKWVCGLWQLRQSVVCGKVCYPGDVLKRVRKRTRKLVWSGIDTRRSPTFGTKVH